MIKTLRQPSQGALCVVTVVQVVKEHCANVSNKSPADWKDTKAPLNDKMTAVVRIGAKVEKFTDGTLQQLRLPNKWEHKQRVDKTYWL